MAKSEADYFPYTFRMLVSTTAEKSLISVASGETVPAMLRASCLSLHVEFVQQLMGAITRSKKMEEDSKSEVFTRGLVDILCENGFEGDLLSDDHIKSLCIFREDWNVARKKESTEYVSKLSHLIATMKGLTLILETFETNLKSIHELELKLKKIEN